MRQKWIGWLLLAWFVSLPSCAPFRPSIPEDRPFDAADDVLHIGFLSRKQTLEIEGFWNRGVFEADRIEIREPDDEIELKGTLTRFNPERARAAVGGVSLEISEDVRYADADNSRISADRFATDEFVKAECRLEEGGLRLVKLQLRERRPDEADELQGRVDRIDFARTDLRIGGIRVRFDYDIPVIWDLETPPSIDGGAGLQRALSYQRSGMPRIRNFDDDDVRPLTDISDNVAAGGEIQYDMEYRGNHDLKEQTDRDRLVHELSAKLDLSFKLADQVYAFTQGRVRQKFVHFDQDRDLDYDAEFRLGEAFVYAEDWIAPGVALQLGRQDFDHGREWVMDELLDAVRLYFNLGDALLEASASTLTFGGGDAQEGVKNYLVAVHNEPWRDVELFSYVMHRHGGTQIDLERTHLGVSLEGRTRPFAYWGDVGYVIGTEDELRVRGYGFDLAAMFAPAPVDLRPSVYAGYAYGSGDRERDTGGVDRNFRQTGLHDNNDKFNGVTSFRYLGELVRPELGNLQVLTLGAGFRPARRSSVDLVFHNYRQVEAAPFFEGSRLRQMPTGDSPDIGNEIDLIIGIEDFRPFQVEIVGGYFVPGSAFAIRDDAWFAALEMEWRF